MKLDKHVQITGIVAIAVLIVAIMFMNSANPNYNNTVSVSGTATIPAMPDLVGVYFSVDTQGTTSQEAASKNSDIVTKLKDSLIARGFLESEIQTQGYNIYPDYNYETNTIKGYRATHSLRIELPANESSKLEGIIDSAVTAGAGISYINFELSQEKQNTYKAEAMKLAAQDATTKAEAVAEGLDKDLGKLVSVSVNDYNYVPWLAYDASGASESAVKEAARSITPTDQDVSATITAIYKIR